MNYKSKLTLTTLTLSAMTVTRKYFSNGFIWGDVYFWCAKF